MSKQLKITALFLVFYCLSFSQINMGGLPESFSYSDIGNILKCNEVEIPDVQKLIMEDSESDRSGRAYRYAVNIPVCYNISDDGKWTELPTGERIWQLKLAARDAEATAVYFDNFWLPKGSKLFVYNESKTHILGAYTSFNNSESGLFGTELVEGDVFIVEYYEPADQRNKAILNINEISYAYRGTRFSWNKSFGDSDDCQVNVNCSPEGDIWQSQKRGVARISIKIDGDSYWCSGSLVNNTRQDGTPYLLTADHCTTGADDEDMELWIFYFNYESGTCANPGGEPSSNSILGSSAVSRGPQTKSDFYLLKLKNFVPVSFNPYFNGWDRSTSAPANGVGIHHPSGDIKKISHFSSSSSGTWVIPNTHWKLKWDTTANGHGVTEGGSSGSPLFNNSGLIVGTLSGGFSACVVNGAGANTGPGKSDLYGKFSYHWISNGGIDLYRLEPWLDPDGLNPTTLPGMDGYTNQVNIEAEFESDASIIYVGDIVHFTDVSYSFPNTTRRWTFNGGSPETGLSPNQSITYNNEGVFDVSLAIKSVQDTDTLEDTEVKSNLITVIDTSSNDTTSSEYIISNHIIQIYPNPANDILFMENVDFSVYKQVLIYSISSKLMLCKELEKRENIQIDLSELEAGTYFIQIQGERSVYSEKFIIGR